MKHEMALQRTKELKVATPNYSGTWLNELNSVMNLTVSGAQLTGIYTSAVSSGGSSITGSLAGFINGDVISFVVLWPTAAITAWVGHHVIEADGTEAIETLWHLAKETADPDDPNELWTSVLAGADRFHR